MKRVMMIMMSVTMLLAAASIGWSQQAASNGKPTGDAAKSERPTLAELRATMHRTLADLIEAQAADKPDQARIDQLQKQVDALRGQIRAEAAATGALPPGMRRGGGPGMGYGAGWGGPGRGYGYGRGPGWGRGPGYGRGPGLGFVDADRDGICDRFESVWGASGTDAQ